MQHFELWIFRSNNNLNIFGTFDCISFTTSTCMFDVDFSFTCSTFTFCKYAFESNFCSFTCSTFFETYFLQVNSLTWTIICSTVIDKFEYFNIRTLGHINSKQSWNYSSTLVHREDIFTTVSWPLMGA